MRDLIIFLMIFSGLINGAVAGEYLYLSPKPNSDMISKETNVIIRDGGFIDESTVNQDLIHVMGSKSGNHSGEFLLTDDQKTIIFNPHSPFVPDEVVTVALKKGLRRVDGKELAAYSFSFQTAPSGIVQQYGSVFEDDKNFLENLSEKSSSENMITETLPAPPIQIDSLNNPSPGYIFMATCTCEIWKFYFYFK